MTNPEKPPRKEFLLDFNRYLIELKSLLFSEDANGFQNNDHRSFNDRNLLFHGGREDSRPEGIGTRKKPLESRVE
jgi:hypothetical protein